MKDILAFLEQGPGRAAAVKAAAEKGRSDGLKTDFKKEDYSAFLDRKIAPRKPFGGHADPDAGKDDLAEMPLRGTAGAVKRAQEMTGES